MAETATSEDEYESAMSDNWLDVITGVEGFDFSVELFLDESSLFLSLALSDVFFLADVYKRQVSKCHSDNRQFQEGL